MLETLGTSLVSASLALDHLRAKALAADFEELSRIRSFCADLIRTLSLRQGTLPQYIRDLCRPSVEQPAHVESVNVKSVARELSREVTRLFTLLQREDGAFTIDAQDTYRALVQGLTSRQSIFDELDRIALPLSPSDAADLLKIADQYEVLIRNLRDSEQQMAVWAKCAQARLDQMLSTPSHQIFTKEISVSNDQYNFNAPVSQSVFGNNNSNNFTIYTQNSETLRIELGELVKALRREPLNAESLKAAQAVEDANASAATGDQKSLTEHLRKAGEWALDVATKIGVSVAAEAIKKSMFA